MSLERYELGEIRFKAGPSTFFSAVNRMLENDVVVRRLDVDPARGYDDVRDTFFREQRLMSRLNHPSIQQPIDIFEGEGYLYSVHELRPAQSSFDRVRENGRLSITQAARLGSQVADALGHMHDQGLVHGRIAPQSVLLDERDEALLINFVKAADMAAGIWPLRPGVQGLSAFSAPEEVAGERPSPKSDLYSLAACIAWWLTGGDSSGTVELKRDPTAAAAGCEHTVEQLVSAEVPEALVRRLETSLATDPAERKGSVSGLGALLTEVYQRTVAEIPAGFDSGTRLTPRGSVGEIEIRGRHGAGAFGVVFRVSPPDSDVNFALKALKPEHRDDREAHDRFVRETRALAAIDHVNVVHVVGVGRLEGTPYAVMDFIDGPDLATLILREGMLEPARAAALAASIARGLGAIHDGGLVHRDIKPHNVLVAPGDRPVIADFGMASGRQHTRLTMTGQAVGTPAYMAPEQFEGETPSPAVDLWALGVILHEMLTGDVPFRGEGTLDVIRAIRSVPHDPLPESVPAVLREIVERLLAKRPADRPSTGAEVAVQLDAASAASR